MTSLFAQFEKWKEYYVKSYHYTGDDGKMEYQVWSLYVDSISFIPLIGHVMNYTLYLNEGKDLGGLRRNLDKYYSGRHAIIRNYNYIGDAWIEDSDYGIKMGRITATHKLDDWIREHR